MTMDPEMSGTTGRTIVDPATQEELFVPSYSTTTATLRRAQKARDGMLRIVRIFPDHGHPWPLWDPAAGYTASPDTYGLSAGLTEALAKWYLAWEAAVGSGDGWPTDLQRMDWERQGDELVVWLTRELWDVAEVRAEFHRD